VTVKSTDLDGDGVTDLDFDDTARFADSYGTGDAAADFDGDGQVGPADLALFLGRLGGEP
jgi:hypothetical protein